MKKCNNFFSTQYVSHRRPFTMYIIDGESKLIETAGLLFVEICYTKMEADRPRDDANLKNMFKKKNLV